MLTQVWGPAAIRAEIDYRAETIHRDVTRTRYSRIWRVARAGTRRRQRAR
ncbi:hypothetical protein EV191_111131 [Tamaricihabitans halophyticus]|uniref:Uncharacterized protein n=1 Tax=Tamaricihabitans halophyticus TaxID=1262583 RepID=A0A4V2SSV4_9PSEU|nr:hypothetical protein [Tamaricihabitans halophyticus]TCP47926.1 hypothetical protein EV191_111131 [Tamaricihabitans halophyticus]